MYESQARAAEASKFERNAFLKVFTKSFTKRKKKIKSFQPQNKPSNMTSLQEIREMRSNNTNLITYYVRGDQANQTSAFLRDELSQSNNIKAKETRTGVQDALRAIVRNLKDVARIPARGLCIFSGAGHCL
jgi:hypothetical protein